jgi:hypothetical protein
MKLEDLCDGMIGYVIDFVEEGRGELKWSISIDFGVVFVVECVIFTEK